MPERGNNKTKKNGCYACKYSKPEALHGRQETRCLLDNMLVFRPSKGCTKQKKDMTNGDRIRHMSDEELADVMQGQCACCAYQLTGCTEKECKDGAYEWLKQEVSEDAAD